MDFLSLEMCIRDSSMNDEDLPNGYPGNQQIYKSNINDPMDTNRQDVSKDPYQIHQAYIISPVASGFMTVSYTHLNLV